MQEIHLVGTSFMAKKANPAQSKVKNAKRRRSLPTHEGDIPVTQRMLYLVRDQLDQKLSAVKSELKSDIASVRLEIGSVKSDLKADIATLNSNVSRIALLVEEQNARNNVVLDGLTSLFHRQDRVEAQVQHLTDLIIKSKTSV
jgi:hypothetical protein